MPFLAILVGAILIGLGLQGYYDFGDLLGVEKEHKTALIPAGVGRRWSSWALSGWPAPPLASTPCTWRPWWVCSA